jgi:hypothetical protein
MLASRIFEIYSREKNMSTILLIILILIVIGALPSWSHSRSWGYAPSGVTGIIVLVLIIMLLTGRL